MDKNPSRVFYQRQALENVQPKDLEASEIEVRLGATWIKTEYNKQFMAETFQTPAYLLGKSYPGALCRGKWSVEYLRKERRQPWEQPDNINLWYSKG